jgi:hypothetical protein
MNPADFSFLVDPEPRLNATLIQGHQLIAVLALAGASNPRLYAEPNVTQGAGDLLIPETSTEKPADWTDTSRDLTTMGVPQDLAIDLSYAVDQDLNGGAPPANRNVAEALKWVDGNDPIFGMQEFLSANPFLPNQNAAQLALQLPGVMAAVKTALAAMAKPR